MDTMGYLHIIVLQIFSQQKQEVFPVRASQVLKAYFWYYGVDEEFRCNKLKIKAQVSFFKSVNIETTNVCKISLFLVWKVCLANHFLSLCFEEIHLNLCSTSSHFTMFKTHFHKQMHFAVDFL